MSNRDSNMTVGEADSSQPLFPPQRAFVVQFARASDAGEAEVVGRIEHVVSGHAHRFSSSAELLRIIASELRELAGDATAASGLPPGDREGEIDDRK